MTPTFAAVFFFFNDTATTEIYTLSLHDALPIWAALRPRPQGAQPGLLRLACPSGAAALFERHRHRSEEHTSELQSQSNLVCRLLLEKKKATSHILPPQLARRRVTLK